jgi:CheY-like chemotaxis protein
VLLVEDDPSMRRFVGMALDELDIELLQCASVAEAVEALSQAPVALILTDLMMPGESGFGLLQRLQQSPPLRGGARVAVLSAGLTGPVREQLGELGVWRTLSKPVSVGVLEACVKDALSHDLPTGAATDGVAPDAAEIAVDGPDSGSAHAVAEYFEGDLELFRAYRAACLAQFPHDIQDGDAASAAADLQALRRLAHSLKSVLLALGDPQWSARAQELEDTSHAGVLVAAQQQWATLRAQLVLWVQTG